MILETGGPRGPGQGAGRPHLHRDCSPPVHHPECRHDRGLPEWPSQGVRHAPPAAGAEGHLLHHGQRPGWSTDLMNSFYSVPL